MWTPTLLIAAYGGRFPTAAKHQLIIFFFLIIKEINMVFYITKVTYDSVLQFFTPPLQGEVSNICFTEPHADRAKNHHLLSELHTGGIQTPAVISPSLPC